MKVKQLDYSSMINANQMMLATRNANTANMSAKFNRENIAKMESIYKLKGKAEKWQNAANIAESIYSTAMNAGKVYQIFQSAQAANEEASATNDYTNIVGQFDVAANELNQQGKMFNPDGSYSEEYNALLSEYNEKIDALGYSQTTTKGMKNSFSSYSSKTYGSNLSDYINTLNESTATERQTLLDDAIKARDYSAVEGLVNSWNDLPAKSKEVLLDQVSRAIDVGKVSDEANAATDLHGYNDGKKVLDQALKDGTITQEKYDELNAGIFSRHAANKNRTAQVVNDTWNQTFEETGNFVTSRRAAMMEVDKAPEEDRADLTNAIDQLQLNQFYKENQWFNDLPYMLSSEVQEKIDEIEADEAKYFIGMDGTGGSNDVKGLVLQSMKLQKDKTEANEIKALDTGYKDQLKTQKEGFSDYVDSQYAQINTGLISPTQGVANIKAALYSDDYSLLMSTDDGGTIAMNALYKMMDTMPTSWYNSNFKSRVQNLDNVFKDLGISGVDVSGLQFDLAEAIMDMYRDYGDKDLTDQMVDNLLSGIESESFSKTLEVLGKSNDIKWGGGYSSDTADITDYMNLLSTMMGSGLYYQDTSEYDVLPDGSLIGGVSNMGGTKGITSEARMSWQNSKEMGAWTLGQLGIDVNVENSDVMVNDEGYTIYVPAFNVQNENGGSTLYSVAPRFSAETGQVTGGVIQSKTGDGKWTTDYTISMDGIATNVKTGEKTNLATGKKYLDPMENYHAEQAKQTEQAQQTEQEKQTIIPETQEAANTIIENSDLSAEEKAEIAEILTPGSGSSSSPILWKKTENLSPEGQVVYRDSYKAQVEELTDTAEGYSSLIDFQNAYKGTFDPIMLEEAYFNKEWNAILDVMIERGSKKIKEKEVAEILANAGCSQSKIDEFIQEDVLLDVKDDYDSASKIKLTSEGRNRAW